MSVSAAAKQAVRSVLSTLGLLGLARRMLRRRPEPVRPYRSETSKCRHRLAAFCRGYGLDLGFGGDPITDYAIRMDMPQPAARTGDATVQLGGRAEDLRWFRDDVLDFVYSSHLLEDFDDTEPVLREWLRVLKPGGRLIIFCPNEQEYRRHCAAAGRPPNAAHKHADFSLPSVKTILDRIGQTRIIHENPLVDDYSWELVCEKTGG
jgi:SAM-dependent methyltransferase